MKSVNLEVNVDYSKKFEVDFNKTTLDDILEDNTHVKIEGYFSTQEMRTLLLLIASWGNFEKILIPKKKYDKRNI